MFGRLYLVIFAIGIIFLPFTRAFTIDVGAPIKLYEGIFAAAIFSFVLSGMPIERSVLRRYGIPLLMFLGSVTISYILALFADNRAQFDFRGGVAVDGFLRIGYLVINIFVFALSYRLAKEYPRRMMQLWLAGMTISVLYLVYCALALRLTGEAFMLPGIERHQLGDFGPITIVRSGTFEEGNFGGFYFLLSIIVAMLAGYPALALVALVGLVLTKSTSAYFGLVALVGFYILLRRHFRVIVVPVIAVVAAAIYGLFTYFEHEGKFEAGNSSGAVRMNEVMTAIEMFKEHVLFGVGLGQYGFKYYLYHWDPSLDALSTTARHITNNIYAELLAETGLVGCLIFAVFWARWLGQARRLIPVTPLFYASGISMMIVWLAYPTFNIAFMWAFLGFAVAMMNRAETRTSTPAPRTLDSRAIAS